MQGPDFRQRAVLRRRGNFFEDFEPGRVFHHHWGRTLTESDNTLFTALTMHSNPLHFNTPYAKAHGHPSVVINPYLVFNTIFGLSVEDLSESGGAFLGIEQLSFHEPVYPGDTLSAVSTVVDRRESSSNPKMGIASWHTEGFNQDGVRVIDFRRTNLVARRPAA